MPLAALDVVEMVTDIRAAYRNQPRQLCSASKTVVSQAIVSNNTNRPARATVHRRTSIRTIAASATQPSSAFPPPPHPRCGT
jgi:hypothetical protein